MICSHLKAAFASALLISSSIVCAQSLTKPALRSNLEDFNSALTTALPVPKSTVSVWNFGTIAEQCKFEAQQNNFNPGNVLVFNVTYTDCDVPYVLCIHRDHPVSYTTLIDTFGKVPPRMRQFVRTITFLPGSGWAYARGPDVVMLGNHDRVGVYIHEVMHAAEASDAFKSQALMADQAPWQSAYNGDSAVPDDYARNNQRENLAQHPMFVIYQDFVGNLDNIEPNWRRISQQQYIVRAEAAQNKYGGAFFDTSGVRCSFRHPFPNKVSTSTSKRAVQARQIPNFSTFEISKIAYEKLGVGIIDPKTLPTGKALEATKCNFH